MTLTWHIIGGSNKHRIGMNSGLCTYDDGSQTSRVLFDAGSLIGDTKNPEDPALSDSDTIIPDLSRYLERADDPQHRPDQPLDAIFITHNHSDHVGALPMLALMGYKLPKIYCTPYTAKRIEQEFAAQGFAPEEYPRILTIAPGAPVDIGAMKISAFWVSHSTPQSAGFFIETPEGNILAPGDFKLDQTVVWGPAFNEEQFKKLAGRGIDLMLMDSTGADRDVEPITEEDVRETLRDLFALHPGKRFIVSVMSGFEENLASVAKVAGEEGRKLWVAGASHEQALMALKMTGLSLSDSIGQEVEMRLLTGARATRELAEDKPGSGVVVVTGAQGKPGAALTRAAEGNHPALKLDPKKDVILFCAPSIPGQEGYRERLLYLLRQQGFKVLTRADANLYSQAHARLPEILRMAAIAGAKTFVPAHGDKNLRAACGAALEKQGHKTMQADNGAVFTVSRDGVRMTRQEKVPVIGFKTLQGQNWTDRDYAVTKITIGDGVAAPAAPRKKPRLFDAGGPKP